MLERFLELKNPSDQQDFSDIYHSMLEIQQNIEADPTYDVSVIVKWLDKVEEILEAENMRSFLSAAKLADVKVIDFDMLARSIWFPDDFRFTAKNRKLLKLLKDTTLAQDKD